MSTLCDLTLLTMPSAHVTQSGGDSEGGLEGTHPEVKDEALEGEAQVGGQLLESQLSRGIHHGLAPLAAVLVLPLELLNLQRRHEAVSQAREALDAKVQLVEVRRPRVR